MEKVKSIYDYDENIFDVEEIKSICQQFGVQFEVFDVECNSSDEATLISGKLQPVSGGVLTPETLLKIEQAISDTDLNIATLAKDDLLQISFEEEKNTGRD